MKLFNCRSSIVTFVCMAKPIKLIVKCLCVTKINHSGVRLLTIVEPTTALTISEIRNGNLKWVQILINQILLCQMSGIKSMPNLQCSLCELRVPPLVFCCILRTLSHLQVSMTGFWFLFAQCRTRLFWPQRVVHRLFLKWSTWVGTITQSWCPPKLGRKPTGSSVSCR